MPRRLALALSLALACSPTVGSTEGGTGEPATGDASASGATMAATGSGTTATPTTGGPAGLHVCTPSCSEEGQPCRIDGFATEFLCLDGVCEFSPCTSDKVCQLRAAGWGADCLDDSMCTAPGHVCVADDGQGRCAPLEDDVTSCADMGLVPLARAPIGGGEDVIVCGDTSARCTDGNCVFPCKSDADCLPELGRPHCEVATGQCRCSDDAECLASGAPGLVACLDGRCGCSVDADCAGGTNVDVCVDGACGCSSDAACTDPVFTGVVQVCRPA